MQKLSLLVAALLVSGCLATQAPTAAPPDARAAESQLVAAERAWMGAVQARDRATLERLMADDFVLTGALKWRRSVSKATYIQNALDHYVLERFAFDSTRVRVLGSVALVQTLFREKATYQSIDGTGTFALTDVWVWRDGRWQVVERHSEKVSSTAP